MIRLAASLGALTLFAVPAVAENDCHYTWTRDGSVLSTCGDESILPEAPSRPADVPCQQVISQRTYLVADESVLTASRTDTGEAFGELITEIGPGEQTRTIRLTGSTTKDLTNASFRVQASDGFRLEPDSATAFTSPAGSESVAAVGIGSVQFEDDGNELQVSFTQLPADASFSFEVTAHVEGELPLLTSSLTGTIEGCSTTPPADVTSYTAWRDVELMCADGTASQERVKTATAYIWSEADAAWVTGEPVHATEQRTRQLNAAEVKECPAPETVTYTAWRDVRQDCTTKTVERQRTKITSTRTFNPVERIWEDVAVPRRESTYRPMSEAEAARCQVPGWLSLSDLLTWGD